ncbi:MAG: hypothetical protein CVT86_08635 [Alphaproteobacteria bacterium HGW-Alphaproteobacteria-8]|nr:MAG: hypothetical protein CVT86_08635 [Alphaproteobacteria bacterium HGW-Alphaproteobacteria-8]
MEAAMRVALRSPRAPRAPLSLRALWRRVMVWRALARERRALAALDPHLLRDMGLDAGSAAQEADRPFWDVPPGR